MKKRKKNTNFKIYIKLGEWDIKWSIELKTRPLTWEAILYSTKNKHFVFVKIYCGYKSLHYRTDCYKNSLVPNIKNTSSLLSFLAGTSTRSSSSPEIKYALITLGLVFKWWKTKIHKFTYNLTSSSDKKIGTTRLVLTLNACWM